MDSYEEEDTSLMNAYSLKPTYGEGLPRSDTSWRQPRESAHKYMINHSFVVRPFVMTSELLSSRLPLTTLHNFCNKGCAMYCIPNLSRNSRQLLFQEVYTTWHMPNECCIAYGAFATQFIGSWEKDSPKDVGGIIETHKQLCEQVEKRQKTLDEIDGLLPSTLREVSCHSNFEMTQSFRSAVIIIDKEDWYNEGVLFVRTLYREGLELWPITPSDSQGQNESIGYDKGTRMTLLDAVDLVIQMQLDVETEEQKALNQAPLVSYHWQPPRPNIRL